MSECLFIIILREINVPSSISFRISSWLSSEESAMRKREGNSFVKARRLYTHQTFGDEADKQGSNMNFIHHG